MKLISNLFATVQLQRVHLTHLIHKNVLSEIVIINMPDIMETVVSAAFAINEIQPQF